MFEIITVRQLPPIESFNKRVSLEFRYGMYLDPSANALMQFPKKCYLLYVIGFPGWDDLE